MIWRRDFDGSMSSHWILMATEAHNMCTDCPCQHATGNSSLCVTPVGVAFEIAHDVQ